MRILDVGCGRKKVPGSVGADVRLKVRPDVVCDLDRFPYPFRGDLFEAIYCLGALDHLDDVVGVMEELHRFGKPGARLYIRVPHYSSIYSWSDPVHRHHFSSRSLLCFTDDHKQGAAYTEPLFRQREVRFIFSRSVISLIPRLLAWLSPWVYEKHFAFIFPANDVFFELEVLK